MKSSKRKYKLTKKAMISGFTTNRRIKARADKEKRRSVYTNAITSRRRTKLAKAISDIMIKDLRGPSMLSECRKWSLYRRRVQRVEQLLKKWKV